MPQPESDTIILTREELYERVWTTAMRHLGPELGVSDVGLKKICKRFNIPTPPLGYWAKKEHGKAPKRPALPEYDDPDLEGIKFYPNGDGPKLSEQLQAAVEHEKDVDNKIVVSNVLEDPHPLVEKTLASIIAAKPDEQGLVRPRAKKTLDVHVSPDNVDRAMRIMDALLKALDVRELPFELVRGEDRWSQTVTVEGETITFVMEEHVDREERAPTPKEERESRWMPFRYRPLRFYDYTPTGKLSLRILDGPSNGRRRRYSDTPRQKLDNMLNTFVACLHRTAGDIKTERQRIEERERKWAEQERQRQEWERQREQKLAEIRAEEAALESLFSDADDWHKSQRVTSYVNAFREAALAYNGTIDEEQEQWLTWAEGQAKRLNPLVDGPPSILDEREEWEIRRYW